MIDEESQSLLDILKLWGPIVRVERQTSEVVIVRVVFTILIRCKFS